MPSCGSQCYLCDYPVRFDTYKGCSHGCKYCFVQRAGKYDIKSIKVFECVKALQDFISGKRSLETKWVDWKIPLHWGGVSDPFQPIEKQYKNSYKCLQVFAKTKYPFIVSSKGRISAETEYLELLKECNCVYQVSAVCSKYDVVEAGAPSFSERLEIMKKISPVVKRLIVRIQPYMCEVMPDVLQNLVKFRDCGAYGVIIEGMKFFTSKAGLVKIGADYCYPYDVIRNDFLRLREKAHKLGLKIYAGENRIRALGDSLSCCGADGIDGFVGNVFNLNHILNKDMKEPTSGQKIIGTATCFQALYQDTVATNRLKKMSFASAMVDYYAKKKKLIDMVFGVKR